MLQVKGTLISIHLLKQRSLGPTPRGSHVFAYVDPVQTTCAQEKGSRIAEVCWRAEKQDETGMLEE